MDFFLSLGSFFQKYLHSFFFWDVRHRQHVWKRDIWCNTLQFIGTNIAHMNTDTDIVWYCQCVIQQMRRLAIEVAAPSRLQEEVYVPSVEHKHCIIYQKTLIKLINVVCVWRVLCVLCGFYVPMCVVFVSLSLFCFCFFFGEKYPFSLKFWHEESNSSTVDTLGCRWSKISP